ncbi:MAG: FAD-dependent oxidoreductase [Lachnospiraceae bacterium]
MSDNHMTQKQKGLIGLGAMVILGAVTVFGSGPIYKAIDNMARPAVSYTAGTYTGTAQGFGGEVTAEVTVSDKAIETVVLTGANETPGIGSNAIEQLPAAIVENQTAEVDAVAGATVTSNAVKEAVKNALAQASGEGAATETTEAASQPAAADGKFIPGTYTAKATGMGEMEVEVVVTEDTIESVTILSHNETPGISDLAISDIPANIVAAQGLGIDTVSGATISSNAILAAVTDCLTQAGADIEALKQVSLGAAEQAEDQELTADVIVIGAGGAGMAAAVTANEAGASVIVIEKMPKVGGNTTLAGGALNAVDDGSETALANEDSVQKHYDQTMAGGDNQGDPELVRTLVENAWDGVEWLKGLGMEFLPGTFTVTGGMWPRAHKPVEPVGTGFFKTYNEYIEKHDNIEVMLNTKAVEIQKDADGRVTTVIAEGETGNKITLHANNGVVVATGGFAKNVELREKYNKLWPTLGESIKSTNHEGATGDAIPMLEALGAEFVQMENIQLLPLGDPETGSLSGNIEHDVERRIFINKEGNRFVNEGGRRDEMTLALFEQTDNYMWIVMDSDCYPTGDEVNNFNESVNELIEQGRQ